MKKHLLRALCVTFVLSLCLPMVACDMEFGGLVGELLASKEPGGVVPPEEWESDLIIEDILPEIQTAIGTGWDDIFTGDIGETYYETEIEWDDDIEIWESETVWDTTEPPSIETEPAPIPDPVLFFSFDECDARIGDQQVQQFFSPGTHASWDSRAVIDDYNVEYVRIWGWAAFSSEQIGEIGYCIDYDEYVFDSAFLIDTEQAVIDAALSMGARSASRICVTIPVRDLSGKHVIELVARDEFGYLEIFATFDLEKAVDPYAPVFELDPATIESAVFSQSNDVTSGGLSLDGSYVTLTCPNGADPYINLLSSAFGSSAYSNVKFIVFAYRTDVAGNFGEFFAGSDAGPVGGVDEVKFDYVADGAWHTYVLDLSKIDAINDSFDLSYLRYDIYANCAPGQSIDVAYIAGFDSMEDVIAYQAKNNLG